MSEETKDTKITSVEKSKDPRRVEAGKKLGAISRQAKEKKMHGKKVEAGFEPPTLDPSTIAVGIAGVVGMVVYYYYRSSQSSKEAPKENRENREEQAEPAKQASPLRRELDTLD